MPRAPVVREISWFATIPQFLIYAAAFTLGAVVGPGRDGPFIAIGLTLVYSLSIRTLVPQHHRRGLALTHQGRWEDAIEAHQRSYDFFTRNAWVDRYRSVVLMSPAAAGYREMALCNIGYCYLQLGEGQKAEAVYRRALQEFPDSNLASAAIRMIEACSPK